MGLRTLYARSGGIKKLLEQADKAMAGADFLMIKDIARNRAGFLSDPQQGRVFIKRFATASWAEGMVERLRGSRAARSLRAAAYLTQAGFLCPAPLGASELRAWGAIRRSYLVSEALFTPVIISAFLNRRRGGLRRQVAWRRRMLSELARCVRRLHDSGLFSSDLQQTNLMLEENCRGLAVYFVDLDGFRRVRRVRWARRRRNLVQLDRSIGLSLSRGERFHFLREYLGRDELSRGRLRALLDDLLRERERKDHAYARRWARQKKATAAAPTSRMAARPQTSKVAG